MGRTLSIGTILKFYWAAAARYRGLVLGCLFAIPFAALANPVVAPLIVSHVLTRLAEGDFERGETWGSFDGAILAYAAVTCLGLMVAWRVVDAFAWRLEARVSKDLAQRSFDHLTTASADFHASTFGGSLVSQTTKLLSAYVRIADTTIFLMLPLVWILGGMVAILAFQAPLFAVLLATFALLYMVTAVYASRPVRRRGSELAAAESAQTGALADAITNVMAIKSFARERHERERFAVATERSRVSLLRLCGTHQRQMAYFGGISSTISVAALAVAIYGVVGRGAEVGTVYLIVAYTSSATQQLFQFSNNALRTYNRAFGDATEMIGVLGQAPTVRDAERPEPSRIGAGEVRFENVTFRHSGAQDALFEGLDLTVRAGEKVGLVGHSGAGKTSVTRLLLRFSDVSEGRILIDGQDIAAVAQADLHAAIAYVPQEPLLFHRSIRENIAYGNLAADDAAIRRAAERANALEFVDALPHGLDTLVGERGVKLSGGQRQRIAIARAMLKDAPILVLDEATSALDSHSELLIQDALRTLMAGRTTIVIAHRLSTIARMDRIVVLDDGAVAESGSHAELLEDPDGIYASLWLHQSGGFVDDEDVYAAR
ncbi:MAG: ABC transporter ATP-binding protein [Sporichthyaceae bacterium]